MILAVDTETTGSDFWHGCRPFMITACDGTTNYAWTGKVNPYNRLEVTWDKQDLDEVQELLDSASVLVFHNAKFDIRALESIGVDAQLWHKVEDTMLASHAVCSGERHALKYLAFKYLDYYNEGEKALAKAVQDARLTHQEYDLAKHGHSSFPGISAAGTSWYKMDYWLCVDECLQYGTDDVEMTWLLWHLFKNVMEDKDLMEVYTNRKWLLHIAYDMEKVGLNLYEDRVRLEIRIQQAIQRSMQDRIKEELRLRFPLDFKKKRDLRMFLFDLLELPLVTVSEKTGLPLMNKEVIAKYIKENPDIAPLQHYADYVTAGTKISYLEGYLRWLCLNGGSSSHFSSSPATSYSSIHANFFITGTRETRQSVTSPNTQNIDKRLRHIFGPPEGYIWLDYDLVNIEMRAWVYEVNNPEMVQIFNSGGSVHLLVASVIHPKLYKEVGEDFKKVYEETWYQWVKNGNFAIIYGATQKKADITYKVPGAYHKIAYRFPEVPQYTKKCIYEAESNLCRYASPHVTCIGGYRLDVDMSAPFKACNYKIQGSAGYFINLAMRNIFLSPLYHSTKSRMVNQVHDSIIIQVPIENNSEELQLTLKSCIEAAGLEFMPTCEASYKIIYHPKDLK